MCIYVPMACDTRNDKDALIEETINHLEQNIKIIKPLWI